MALEGLGLHDLLEVDSAGVIYGVHCEYRGDIDFACFC